MAMRQSIHTFYIGPRAARGSRVKAVATGGQSLTLGWDHSCNSETNHMRAAAALAEKLKWSGTWHAGDWFDGGCVFVNQDGSQFTVAKS